MAWDWDDLSGAQLEQIHAALLSAFTNADDLARFLTFKMDVNLNAIATGSLSNQMFEVISWSRAHGRLRELCERAFADRSGSPKIKKLMESAAGSETAPKPPPPPDPPPLDHTTIGPPPERPDEFDVFLCHNSKDKPIVRELANALKGRGLTVWLDEWELIPGRPWQEHLEQIIGTAKSAAVLVGDAGFGPWSEQETRALLSEFVDRDLPVIPVLLPGDYDKPDLPLFLKGMTWVDFRHGLSSDGLARLEWGITGVKPLDNGGAPDARPPSESLPSQSSASQSSAANGGASNDRPAGSAGAARIWREKLNFLQQQEAVTSDASQRFTLKKQIEEAEQKIRELGG